MRRTHPVLPFEINRALNYWAKSYEPRGWDLLWLHMCAAEPLAAILPPAAGSQTFAESGEVLGDEPAQVFQARGDVAVALFLLAAALPSGWSD